MLIDMDDDIRDDGVKDQILLGAILIWPNSLLINISLSIISTLLSTTANKQALGFWDIHKHMSHRKVS